MSIRPLLLGIVLGSALLAGACTNQSPGPATGPDSPAPSGAPLEWQRVPLPGSLSAVTLTASGGAVLVGAFGPERPHPHLLTGSDATSLKGIPLDPRSPYAFEAHWFQVATRDGRIEAIGGARGGAHGNYRWSTWSGTAGGVAEQEQPFGVFGSYGAGDLAGIAYAGGSPVILGAWQSERTGQDIATWTRTGDRWARQPSTGTALGSTPEELVTATAIASRGNGLLLTGSVTHLSPGSVSVSPAVWTSPGPSGPWTRIDLPRVGETGLSAVQGAACTDDNHCLLTGVTDGKVSIWELTADGEGEPAGIPDVEVTENGTILAPVSVGGNDVVTAATDEGSTVLRRTGDDWSVTHGPSGTPTSAAAHGDELWVVTTDEQGTGTLWRARVA